MPTPSHRPREADRPLTFTEQARRAQLVEATIALIAEHGYARCSLQRIADAAGITKAAVIYHFASKDAVIRAAYESVIGSLTAHVAEQIEATATPEGKVDTYVRSLVGYMAAHPTHVRMIVEALDTGEQAGIEDTPASPQRWQPLAELVDAAITAGAYRPEVDARMLAIILGGAIDAVVAQRLVDPTFDLEAATAVLLDTLHRTAQKGQTSGT